MLCEPSPFTSSSTGSASARRRSRSRSRRRRSSSWAWWSVLGRVDATAPLLYEPAPSGTPPGMPAKKTTARRPAEGHAKATPKKRLAEYTAKRDFAKTPEPAGGRAPRAVRRPTALRRPTAPGAARCTTTSGSRWAACSRAGRSRRARRSTRRSSGSVCTSRTIPIEYFDFEGVIPRGEYGGGDVIVWDWGTYEAVHTDDPVQAVADGELHVDLLRREAARPPRADPPGREQAAARSNGSSSTRRTSSRSRVGTPSSSRSRCAAAAPTTRSRPQRDAVWRSDAPAALAGIDFSSTRSDIAALDALGKEGDWEFDGVTLHVTNLDKVLFPGRTKGEQAADEARPDPLLRDGRAGDGAVPRPTARSTCIGSRTASTSPASGTRRSRRTRRSGSRSGATTTPTRARPSGTSSPTGPRRSRGSPTTARSSCTRGRRASPRCTQPTYAMIDVDPGEKTTWEQVAHAHRASTRPRWTTWSSAAFPKVTGQRGIQIWVPIEPGPTFEDTRTWVEALSRLVGDAVPELVSWKWEKRARGGLARLDYTQNAINKTLVAPYSVRPAAGRAGVDADHVGRARRSRSPQRPLDDPRRRRAPARGRRPLRRRCSRRARSCRRSDRGGCERPVGTKSRLGCFGGIAAGFTFASAPLSRMSSRTWTMLRRSSS